MISWHGLLSTHSHQLSSRFRSSAFHGHYDRQQSVRPRFQSEKQARMGEVGQVDQLQTCKKRYKTGNLVNRVEVGQLFLRHRRIGSESG